MTEPKAEGLPNPDPMAVDLPDHENSYIEQLLKTDLRHVFDVMAGARLLESVKQDQKSAPKPVRSAKSA